MRENFLPNPQSPIPSPQSPIPNPQSPIPSPQSPVPSPQSHARNSARTSLANNYPAFAVA
ncbi:hypothetical protein [Nostoc sp. PCC 7524]|uniref:hypothetical protein n=1 Tax=Nostoc sp. (strain ATCC 29411 / PCC 7524) TaxID=28072 RepID=UPI00118187E8|nr:hypothetical protein [Nostoc sp. PCC 7524]